MFYPSEVVNKLRFVRCIISEQTRVKGKGLLINALPNIFHLLGSGGGQPGESPQRRNRTGLGDSVQGLETRSGQAEHHGCQETAGNV